MARPKRSGQHGRVREKAATRYGPAAAPDRLLNGVLLDTDIIIEILRGRSPVSEDALSLVRRGVPLYFTAISCAEIYAGIRRGEEQLTEAFFESRGEVVLDGRTGRRAGEYLATFSRSHGLELGDALIGAAATTTGLKLWTHNRRHFPMRDIQFWEPARR